MGAEALEKVSLYWLCHLPEAGALQIRRIGELAGSFREAYYIEGTQLWKKGILKKEENAYRFDNWKREFSRLEEEYYRLSEKGIRFITPLDADYPKRLYSVYDYPLYKRRTSRRGQGYSGCDRGQKLYCLWKRDC